MSARAVRAGMQRRPHDGAFAPGVESWRRGGDHLILEECSPTCIVAEVDGWRDPTLLATYPAADVSIECIGDLACSDLPAWLGVAREGGPPEP